MGRHKRIDTPEMTGENVKEIALPLSDSTDGYATRHVNLNLSVAQAHRLRMLQCGLDENGKRTTNGRRVVTANDAVRWLIEQI